MDRVLLSLVALACCVLNCSLSIKADEEQQDEVEAREDITWVVPTDKEIDRMLEYGIANYNIFESWHQPLVIEAVDIKVNVAKFKQDAQVATIHVDDSEVLKLFEAALIRSRMRRGGVSDFRKGSGGVGCGNRGEMTLLLPENKQITIGISGWGGFSMGAIPSTYNTFESYMLAQILRDLVKKESKFELSEDLFNVLSGIATIEKQKKLYERMTREEPEEESPEEESASGC